MKFIDRTVRTISAASALMLLALGFTPNSIDAQDALSEATNSTLKNRIRPSELASQIGTGFEWKTSLESALSDAKSSGRFVVWYIPTVPGSFMDRKPEIDRYMMAGPFSWRIVRAFLADHCVAVKAVPTRQQQKHFGLNRYAFIEPGCLILSSDGEVIKRIDRMTTLHPEWWQTMLLSIEPDAKPQQSRPEIETEWQRIKIRTQGKPLAESPKEWNPSETLEWEWLRGVDYFRSGEHQKAFEVWKTASEQFPSEPLAWKLAAEAEGFGPFVRGFETYDPLPETLLEKVRREPLLTSASGPAIYSEEEIWNRSVSYLLGMQNRDGGWRDSDYDFGGTDSLPNVYVAVTALCGLALAEAKERMPHRNIEIQTALERAVQFLIDESNLNRRDRDELTWAHAYRVQFLAKSVAVRPELIKALQSAVQDLEQFQSPNGGWFHEYPNPFVSATALVALAHAREAGAVIDEVQVDKGLAALAGNRFENGAFPYNSPRTRRRSAPKGTMKDIQSGVARNPICELALLNWQASNEELLEVAIKRSFEYNDLLQKALKYDDHTDQNAYGGFFFWYGVYGRGLAISHLTDKTLREEFARHQRDLILSLPELDGCFVDSHELGRCYGTAMALLSLAMCR